MFRRKYVWVWTWNDDDATPRGVFTTLGRAKDAVRTDYAPEYTVEFDDGVSITDVTIVDANGNRYMLDDGIRRMQLNVDRIAAWVAANPRPQTTDTV